MLACFLGGWLKLKADPNEIKATSEMPPPTDKEGLLQSVILSSLVPLC